MPRRGEVWMIDFGMAQKVRPALILSRECNDEDRLLITVVAHTTSLRGSTFEIPVQVPFLKQGAFVVQSVATLPTKQAIRLLGTLSSLQMQPVENGIRQWLQL